MEEILVKHHPLKHLKDMPHVEEKVYLEFHAISLMNGLKYWLLKESKSISAEEAMDFYRYMMSHSIMDLLEMKNENQEIKKK